MNSDEAGRRRLLGQRDDVESPGGVLLRIPDLDAVGQVGVDARAVVGGEWTVK